jgi:signal peptidase I
MAAVMPDWVSSPRTTSENLLDAAPVAIGVQGGGCKIDRARVYRDIYYIAASAGDFLTDYNNVLGCLDDSVTEPLIDRYLRSNHTVTAKNYAGLSTVEALERNALVSDIDAWSGSAMDRQRRTVTFEMGSDEYFPMGDNSSASADARSWREHHVPGRLLIGRAVVVFWPHYWNAPIPFLPNFQRMGLIR